MRDCCCKPKKLPKGLYQVIHYHIDHCGDVWVPYVVPADCCCGRCGTCNEDCCEACRACWCWRGCPPDPDEDGGEGEREEQARI